MTIGATELYNAYKDWCGETGYKAKGPRIFGEEVKRKGIKRSHTMYGNIYENITLNT